MVAHRCLIPVWMDNLLPSAFCCKASSRVWRLCLFKWVSSSVWRTEDLILPRKKRWGKKTDVAALYFSRLARVRLSPGRLEAWGQKRQAQQPHNRIPPDSLSFIHLFIYFYLCLQELSCRVVAPQGARADGFIMLFTCCFTRLASLIFTSKWFSKAHWRLVPAFQGLNWRSFSVLCARVVIPRLSLSIFLASARIQGILSQGGEKCFFVCNTKEHEDRNVILRLAERKSVMWSSCPHQANCSVTIQHWS